ncbi:hypothetical protein CJF42_07370 [Pseudoalteromonas sp. NBT06-2]|uniref:hypothetical protein n=1 Tax=Pseudoalteromonas sp. NBT06-2 TaxID=2025950 RepID=UPI000BA5BBD1|nr:hypothetical protein [Pseudoalteromonas sp. NBT06-2]PAJ75022.1 hypothetical protein CJF42_07370 [Pseudoalteromonas sp. NBT06-2]
MTNPLLSLISASVLFAFSPISHAKIIIGSSIGQTFSQRMETQELQKVEVKNASHLNISVEKSIPNAKYGVFYSNMSTHLKNIPNKKADFNYLLFQSAIDVPLGQDISGYFGAQIGVNNIKPNWLESDTYFATGLYGGVEYHLSKATRFSFETRWLTTIVDNNSKIKCEAENKAEDDNCLWHFNGDLLNQFQTSLGFSYRF